MNGQSELEKRAGEIVSDLGIDIEDMAVRNGYNGPKRIIDFLLHHLTFMNDGKSPTIEGVVNPAITPGMVEWFQEVLYCKMLELEWQMTEI